MGDTVLPEAGYFPRVMAREPAGVDHRVGLDARLDKGHERGALGVWNHHGVIPSAPLEQAGDGHLAGGGAPVVSRTAASKTGFVDLDGSLKGVVAVYVPGNGLAEFVVGARGGASVDPDELGSGSGRGSSVEVFDESSLPSDLALIYARLKDLTLTAESQKFPIFHPSSPDSSKPQYTMPEPPERLAFAVLESPIGPLTLVASAAGLRRLDFGEAPPANGAEDPAHPVLQETTAQLGAYFAGTRTAFDLPLDAMGTPFQQAVWDLLREIPYGATTSYDALARRLGSPGKARAVGLANAKNPLAIVVPCHRVIGKGGGLTGFAGGLEVKAFLLDLEQRRAPVPFARQADLFME